MKMPAPSESWGWVREVRQSIQHSGTIGGDSDQSVNGWLIQSSIVTSNADALEIWVDDLNVTCRCQSRQSGIIYKYIFCYFHSALTIIHSVNAHNWCLIWSRWGYYSTMAETISLTKFRWITWGLLGFGRNLSMNNSIISSFDDLTSFRCSASASELRCSRRKSMRSSFGIRWFWSWLWCLRQLPLSCQKSHTRQNVPSLRSPEHKVFRQQLLHLHAYFVVHRRRHNTNILEAARSTQASSHSGAQSFVLILDISEPGINM